MSARRSRPSTSMPIQLLAAWPLLTLVACGSPEATSEDATPSYPLDDVLRINQLQAKATHNSYHLQTPDTPIIDWQFSRAPLDEQLSEQGARGVELDTHYNPAGHIEVHHVPSVDAGTTCERFVDCLGVVRAWSDAHPGHHTLFVQIEPKDDEFAPDADFDRYAEVMDEEILAVWPRERIVAPDDVQAGAVSLRDAVLSGGWPTLGESRGKVLFFLDERGPFHAAYTAEGADLSGRLLFPNGSADEPIAGVMILNTPGDEVQRAVAAGYIVRTRADGFPLPARAATQRETALATGAQIVTTDFPVDDGEATAFVIPEGTPSRCNPITASADCTPGDIERSPQAAEM